MDASVGGDLGNDGAVIGSGGVAALARVFGDRRGESGAVGSHGPLRYAMYQRVADEDVVDQLATAAELYLQAARA